MQNLVQISIWKPFKYIQLCNETFNVPLLQIHEHDCKQGEVEVNHSDAQL